MTKFWIISSRVAFIAHHMWLGYIGFATIYPTVFEKDIEELKFKANCSWALLSIWNLIIQGVYLFLALVADYMIRDPKKKDIIIKLNGYMFSALLFPLGILTFCMFWGFYFIKKDLLAPEHILNVFPFYVQVGIHATSMLPLFTEILLAKPALPNYGAAVVGLSVAIWLYIAVLVMVYYHFGIWMYSVFEFLSWSGKFLFAVAAYIASIFFLQSGIVFQNFTRKQVKLKDQ